MREIKRNLRTFLSIFVEFFIITINIEQMLVVLLQLHLWPIYWL